MHSAIASGQWLYRMNRSTGSNTIGDVPPAEKELAYYRQAGESAKAA